MRLFPSRKRQLRSASVLSAVATFLAFKIFIIILIDRSYLSSKLRIIYLNFILERHGNDLSIHLDNSQPELHAINDLKKLGIIPGIAYAVVVWKASRTLSAFLPYKCFDICNHASPSLRPFWSSNPVVSTPLANILLHKQCRQFSRRHVPPRPTLFLLFSSSSSAFPLLFISIFSILPLLVFWSSSIPRPRLTKLIGSFPPLLINLIWLPFSSPHPPLFIGISCRCFHPTLSILPSSISPPHPRPSFLPPFFYVHGP